MMTLFLHFVLKRSALKAHTAYSKVPSLPVTISGDDWRSVCWCLTPICSSVSISGMNQPDKYICSEETKHALKSKISLNYIS